MEEFALQVIAKGSYIDCDTGSGKTYLIEAYTLRLNHVALNAWLLSISFNSRDCYASNEEWIAHKVIYQRRHDAVIKQIVAALKIDLSVGSVQVTQALSEVFTAVYIKEIA